MNANRRFLSRATLVLCTAAFVAFLGLGVGCSSDTIDSIKGDATAQGVQTGLNTVLTSTVDPLVSFLPEVFSIVTGPSTARPSLVGVICPDVSSVCGGAVACTVTDSGTKLTFVFSGCAVVTGDGSLTVSGTMVATPGTPTIALSFTNLVINGSPAMTGTGSVTDSTCTYVVDVNTDDGAAVDGTVVSCSGAYPNTPSHLNVSFEDVVIAITFNGTPTANAVATKAGDVVANCTIDLDANPLSSSCSAP